MRYIMDFSPDAAKAGHLPPWEVAKAFAFHVVLRKISDHTETPAAELLGERVDAFIAGQLTLSGGGKPSERAVRAAIARCQDPAWFPGRAPEYQGGRPPVIAEGQKNKSPELQCR